MRYKTLDVVVLDRDVPELELRRGDLGTVVHVYPPDGVEIEFITASGRTGAFATLDVHDIRPVVDTDLITVRPF